MIRHAAQTSKHLVLAVLLIIGGVCALEVGLRVRRATNGAATRSETSEIPAATTAPSRSTFLAVAPKLRFGRVEAQSGRPYTLRTNSFGLRSPEVEIPRPEGCFRILCLGDDSTFAGELPESLTYCRRLLDLVQPETSTRVEVLNAGCPGGCPTISALLLRHRLMMLQPDVIIIHIDPSDLADEELLRRHVERTAEGFPMVAMHPAAAGRTNLAAQLDDELLVVQMMRDEISDLWNRGQTGAVSRDTRRNADLRINGTAFDSIRLALEAVIKLAETQSVEVLVSTASSPVPRPRGRTVEANSRSWPPSELVALCEELQLPLIDATADSDEADAPSRSRRSPARLSPVAHEIYAEALAQAVLERFMGAPTTDLPTARERVSSRTVER